MRAIIYTTEDGRLHIVRPVINTYPVRESITEAQAEQRSWNKLPANAINPRFIPESAIPTDRSERAKWEAVNGSVRVKADTPKA